MIDNYYSDPRVKARTKWYESFDENQMIATMIFQEERIEVPIKFELCPTCDGRGKHVNPSIDCNGLTAEDFEQDPDLLEEIRQRLHDVTCYNCGGRRVVPMIDEIKCDHNLLEKIDAEIEELEAFRRMQESERRHRA